VDSDGVVSQSLVVVTLGLREGERDVEPAELMGVLATQISVVMADRCPRGAIGFTNPVATQRMTERSSAETMPRAVPTAASPHVTPVRAKQSSPSPASLQVTPATDEEDTEAAPIVFDEHPRLALTPNGQTH
jgi:hypothetical protein